MHLCYLTSFRVVILSRLYTRMKVGHGYGDRQTVSPLGKNAILLERIYYIVSYDNSYCWYIDLIHSKI